jgi:hypothetical protein
MYCFAPIIIRGIGLSPASPYAVTKEDTLAKKKMAKKKKKR